jgi:hypothetical protein
VTSHQLRIECASIAHRLRSNGGVIAQRLWNDWASIAKKLKSDRAVIIKRLRVDCASIAHRLRIDCASLTHSLTITHITIDHHPHLTSTLPFTATSHRPLPCSNNNTHRYQLNGTTTAKNMMEWPAAQLCNLPPLSFFSLLLLSSLLRQHSRV